MKNLISRISLRARIYIAMLILCIISSVSLFFIRIKNIDVQGNSWYSSEEIESIVFPNDISKMSALVLLKNLLNNKKNIPFVEDYAIRFKNLFDIELIIYEKSMVASVEYMSSYMYFDKDGIVVESTNTKLDGIPVIKNLKTVDIVLYKKLPVENPDIFGEILNLTQMLKVKDINPSYIEYNNDNTIGLVIGDIKVDLGNINDLSTSISELADILPKLEGLSGELYLNSSKNINSKGMYTFKKK